MELGSWAPGPPQPQGAATPQLSSRAHKMDTHPPGQAWQCTWAGKVQAHSRRPYGPRPQPSAWSPACPASSSAERRLQRAGRGWFSGRKVEGSLSGAAVFIHLLHSFIHSANQQILTEGLRRAHENPGPRTETEDELPASENSGLGEARWETK